MLGEYISINTLFVLNIIFALTVFPTNMWKRKIARYLFSKRQSIDIESMKKTLEENQTTEKENKELVEELY